MDKTDYISDKYQEEVDDFLGLDNPHDTTNDTLPSPEEQIKRLRIAQNINRGHPRKGETREALRQINVSCNGNISEQFTDLSLKTGKNRAFSVSKWNGVFYHWLGGFVAQR